MPELVDETAELLADAVDELAVLEALLALDELVTLLDELPPAPPADELVVLEVPLEEVLAPAPPLPPVLPSGSSPQPAPKTVTAATVAKRLMKYSSLTMTLQSTHESRNASARQ